MKQDSTIGLEVNKSVFMDIEQITRFLHGIQQIEAGCYTAIRALKYKTHNREAFKTLCRFRDDIEALKKNLKPSVFL